MASILPTGLVRAAIVSAAFASLLASAECLAGSEPPASSIVIARRDLLPGRSPAGAVWTGAHAYVLGGTDLDEIARYDPSTNSLALTLGVRLPGPRANASTIWDGTHTFLFGGSRGPALGDILRFDPAANMVSTMRARLPSPRWKSSAVWDPRDRPSSGCPQGCAYVFGGGDGRPKGIPEVLQYNPHTDSLSTKRATLPPGRHDCTSAVWDGNHAYVFGGTAIIRYDPVGDTTVIASALPAPRWGSSAVWDPRKQPDIGCPEGCAYILGGNDGLGGPAAEEIFRFDPVSGRVTTLPDKLPGGRWAPAAVWAGSRILVFGGSGQDPRIGSQILWISPTEDRGPSPPPSPSEPPPLGTLTKRLLELHRSLQSASAKDREAVLNEIVIVARQRKVALLDLVKDNPDAFLEALLKKEVRSAFPAQIQGDLEQEVTAEGWIETIVSDDFEHGRSWTEHILRLEPSGSPARWLSLRFVEPSRIKATVPTQEKVRLRGIRIADRLVVPRGVEIETLPGR